MQLLDSFLQFSRVTAFLLLLIEFDFGVEDLFLSLFNTLGSRNGLERRSVNDGVALFSSRDLEIFFQSLDRLLQCSHCLHDSRSFVAFDVALVLFQSLNEHPLLLQLFVQKLLFSPLEIHL